MDPAEELTTRSAQSWRGSPPEGVSLLSALPPLSLDNELFLELVRVYPSTANSQNPECGFFRPDT